MALTKSKQPRGLTDYDWRAVKMYKQNWARIRPDMHPYAMKDERHLRFFFREVDDEEGATPLDAIPLPRLGAPPRNGNQYTWEDDALNLSMREREEYYGPTRYFPGRDDPTRCRGFARSAGKPCRNPVMIVPGGSRGKFCKSHKHAMFGKRYSQKANRNALFQWTPEAIVSMALNRTTHGAYSKVLRLRLQAALENRDGDEVARRSVTNLMEAMDAVNVEDLAENLNVLLKITMGLIAEMLERYANGRINFSDLSTGMVIFTDQVRRISLAKHEIVGTAEDETDRALVKALNDFGLVALPMNDGGIIDAEAVAVELAERREEEREFDDGESYGTDQ